MEATATWLRLEALHKSIRRCAARIGKALARSPHRHLKMDRDDATVIDHDRGRGRFLQQPRALLVVHGVERLVEHRVRLRVAVLAPVDRTVALPGILAHIAAATRRKVRIMVTALLPQKKESMVRSRQAQPRLLGALAPTIRPHAIGNVRRHKLVHTDAIRLPKSPAAPAGESKEAKSRNRSIPETNAEAPGVPRSHGWRGPGSHLRRIIGR